MALSYTDHIWGGKRASFLNNCMPKPEETCKLSLWKEPMKFTVNLINCCTGKVVI